jgi:hypothetical protein
MFIYLSHSAWLEFDNTAELLFVPAFACANAAVFCIFELFLAGRLLSLE